MKVKQQAGGLWRLAQSALILTIVLTSLSACKQPPSEPEAKNPSAALPPPKVTVTRATRVDVTESVERVGQAEAVEEVELVARVEGYLSKRTFVEGADVRKGDLLFLIEQAPYQIEVNRIRAELDQARAEAVRAELEYKRFQSLVKKQVASQSELDNSRAATASAQALVNARKAELERAQLDLSYTEIRAPFDGRIGEAEYSVGDLVGPNSDALATVVTLDPIYVSWEVSEQIPLAYRRKDQRAGVPDTRDYIPRIRFPDGSLYARPGIINFIDNHVDPLSGTQLVRAEFPNPENIIMPGQYVTISLALGKPKSQLQIPQSAVQQTMQGYFVLVVNDDNTVSQRSIVPGVREGLYWAIAEGLREGDVVVWQGIQRAQPGSKVTMEFKQPGEPG